MSGSASRKTNSIQDFLSGRHLCNDSINGPLIVNPWRPISIYSQQTTRYRHASTMTKNTRGFLVVDRHLYKDSNNRPSIGTWRGVIQCFNQVGTWRMRSGGTLLQYPKDNDSFEAVFQHSIRRYFLLKPEEELLPSGRRTIISNIHDLVRFCIQRNRPFFRKSLEALLLPRGGSLFQCFDRTRFYNT